MNAITISRDGQEFALVNTTVITDVPAGHVVISSNLRETKGSTVTAAQKHRNVLIPEIRLPESVDRRFAPILQDKFYALAKSFLDDTMEQSNRMAKEIPLSAFSIDSLISYFSRVAVSGRISSEQVAAWFDSSATGRYIAEKLAAKGQSEQLAAYKAKYVKFASPNHGTNPNTCNVLLSMLQADDVETTVGEMISEKCAATIKKSMAAEVESL